MKKEFRDYLKSKGKNEFPAVLLASAECAPLSKTGGLADVVGTLPKSFKEMGIDARVITPYHRCIKNKYADQVEHMFYFYVQLGWRREYAGIEKLEIDGVTVYLVDNEHYFGDRIYWGGEGEIEQYAFFTRAVMDALPNLDFAPEIIHCNDWHTAMMPMLAKTQYPGGMQERLHYVLTIHNIAFQGKCSFGLAKDLFGVEDRYLTSEFMELNGCANFMKGGCVFADRVNTVSPSYAREIMTDYYGEGLEGILSARAHEVSGIVNGIDKEVFNPRKDALIPAHYDRGHRKGKAVCKAALQEQMGLEVNPNVPIFAMVTRMTEQKGFDLVACVLDELMGREEMQFMLLGSGEESFENFMRAAEYRYKGRVCAYIGYNEDLAHLIYAGSDFYLMPSRFEPCGLSQMIAMRYGTIPIVRETGGLRDTVMPYNQYTGEGTGFSFANYDAWEMRDAMRTALGCYQNKEVMDGLIANAMKADFGFERSAEEYARLYLCML